VLRQDLQGQPPEGFIPEDRLSRSEALRLFTIDSAFASFEESKKGTLEVGKLADLIVTERDILTVPDDEIKDIRTVMTVVDGQIVWRREGSGI
jgi:predicted amidohydrolase YtcJ